LNTTENKKMISVLQFETVAFTVKHL